MVRIWDMIHCDSMSIMIKKNMTQCDSWFNQQKLYGSTGFNQENHIQHDLEMMKWSLRKQNHSCRGNVSIMCDIHMWFFNPSVYNRNKTETVPWRDKSIWNNHPYVLILWWRFPKMWIPPDHPCQLDFAWISPSSVLLGYPHLWEATDDLIMFDAQWIPLFPIRPLVLWRKSERIKETQGRTDTNLVGLGISRDARHGAMVVEPPSPNLHRCNIHGQSGGKKILYGFMMFRGEESTRSLNSTIWRGWIFNRWCRTTPSTTFTVEWQLQTERFRSCANCNRLN